MGLKSYCKRAANRLLAPVGAALVATRQTRDTMEEAIKAIARRGHPLETVVDIGASDGRWSCLFMRHFPACSYFLIEAQPVHQEALQRFVIKHPNAQYVLAAAGEKRGLLYFAADDPFGGQASYTPFDSGNITVPVTTVDDEVQARGMKGPFLIKLDTHGFEVPILKGASQTLAETEILIIECYNFKIAPECLLFYEMCQFLLQWRFRCIDLVDPLYRPRDDVFWQMDLVFAKETRPEFSYSRYR